jgi:hypothetical protein
MKKCFRLIVLLSVLNGLMLPIDLRAQSPNTQLWYEVMMNYPFANSFNIENAFVYSTLLESPRWKAFDYSPTLEYSLSNSFDLITGATFSYTNQTDNYNTFEIRPMLGTRWHITTRRILTRLQIRLEQRNFKNLETKEWETTYRPRIRTELLIPINKKTYYEDRLLYGILDAEALFAVEGDVEERFANRFRLRIGLGYRLNYNSRFEFIYMNQQSKSGIDEDFESSDNIFRFRINTFSEKRNPPKCRDLEFEISCQVNSGQSRRTKNKTIRLQFVQHCFWYLPYQN